MARLARLTLLTAALALLLGLAWRSSLIVDETTYVVLTEFGKPLAVLGDDPGEAGLHFKRPWQSARVIDRRLRISDPPVRELITQDKKNLEVAPYLVWRVSDPLTFLKGAATPETAALRLEERTASALSQAIGSRPLDAIVTTNPAAEPLQRISDEIRQAVSPAARDELGIELVDLGLKRFQYPLEVRPAVFELIRSERKKVAATLRAEGEATHRTIVSEADRQRDGILAAAHTEAARIQAQAEAEATRVLNAAHAQDPEFFAFLEALATYRAVFDQQATIILSTTSPWLRLLGQGPDLDVKSPPPEPAP